MTDRTPMLSRDSLDAISEVATSARDIQAVFASVGIPFKHAEVRRSQTGVAAVPGVRSHTVKSLQALDLSDPEEVGRVLRAVPRIVELYLASKKVDGTKVIRLKMALEADGFHVGHGGGGFTEALGDLAVSAGNALSDITGIRAEIRRLQQAAPDDPAAAIGRAKNLVEATAKAVLTHRGRPVDDNDSVPALAGKAMEELGVHPKQASAEREQVRRMLGRLQGVIHDLAELRNEVGDGHGSAVAPQDLDVRHGRLAVWSALGWCSYLIDSFTAAPSGRDL